MGGGRRSDPAPHARPAAPRGRRDGDQPERAPAGDPPGGGEAPGRPRPGGLVHATTAGRQRRYRVDQAQLARAAAQLAEVGGAWDARLRRIRRIAEAIQQDKDTETGSEDAPDPHDVRIGDEH
ncbi:hypothetical protein [Actinomadura madurae]|uniref:hypothetical protein n=1 Tax=Actinomadura madurae TaxID=1993 RepID=UPI0020D22CD2|nr:hypothetical protein [Actinomadura madurae]MCQ0009476.1 hypothetical protein [Actinomadura madurae]